MAGMVLWINIRASLTCEKLVTYWPQHSFLGLLNLGDGTCIASRGSLATEGAWLWGLKDWIDRRLDVELLRGLTGNAGISRCSQPSRPCSGQGSRSNGRPAQAFSHEMWRLRSKGGGHHTGESHVSSGLSQAARGCKGLELQCISFLQCFLHGSFSLISPASESSVGLKLAS